VNKEKGGYIGAVYEVKVAVVGLRTVDPGIQVTYVATQEEIDQLPSDTVKLIGENNIKVADTIIKALGNSMEDMRQMMDDFKQNCVVLGLV
jgi:hypothetical protein